MRIFRSMTGAAPATRLVLLTWAVRLGADFQSGTKDALAKALGVSKRKLVIALEYLEQEGYLWKIKCPLERQKNDKSKQRFDYAMSTECLMMWLECLTNCSWQAELISVLSGKSLAEASSAKTSSTLNVNEKLVWGILLLQANKARYVIGCDDPLMCEITGISPFAFQRAIKGLVNKGVISVAAEGVKQNGLFPHLPPIYKMHRQQPDTKIVKFGVALSDVSIVPLRCLSRLKLFYERKRKLRKGHYPVQDSMLSDEQYFQLSEFFSSKLLVSWMSHLCLSTIISLVPTVESYDKEKRREFEDELRSTIMTMFLHGTGVVTPPAEVAETSDGKLSETDVINLLKIYLFDALTEESMYVILELSRYWRLFVECMGENSRIIDYNQRERMIAIGHQQFKVEKNSEGEENKTAILVDELVPFVLTVIAPERELCDDSLAFREHLLMSNTGIKHSKIDHVRYLIYGTESRKLAEIRRDLTRDQETT